MLIFSLKFDISCSFHTKFIQEFITKEKCALPGTLEQYMRDAIFI